MVRMMNKKTGLFVSGIDGPELKWTADGHKAMLLHQKESRAIKNRFPTIKFAIDDLQLKLFETNKYKKGGFTNDKVNT